MLDRETIMDLKTLGWEKTLQKRYDQEARAIAEERAAEKAEEERAAKMGMTVAEMKKHEFREANRAIAVPMSEVVEETVEWLWPEKVPRGTVTIFSGDPGLGKSYVTLDMAMRLSRGLEWPCEEEGKKGGSEEGEKEENAESVENEMFSRDSKRSEEGRSSGGVILLNADDSRSKTVLPRLKSMGANLANIRNITHVLRSGYKMPFLLDRDMSTLKREIKELNNCQLVVLDPLSGYLLGSGGGKADARELIDRLSDLAEEMNVAIVVVNHLRKGSGSAIHRSLGSISVIGRARAAWGFTRCKEDPRRILMVPLKNNLADDQAGLAYSIIDRKVEWETEPLTISADEAFLPVRKARSPDALKKATEWLREKLGDGEWHAMIELAGDAKREDISVGSLKRAKKVLQIESKHNTNFSCWEWRLTASSSEAQIRTEFAPLSG